MNGTFGQRFFTVAVKDWKMAVDRRNTHRSDLTVACHIQDAVISCPKTRLTPHGYTPSPLRAALIFRSVTGYPPYYYTV